MVLYFLTTSILIIYISLSFNDPIFSLEIVLRTESFSVYYDINSLMKVYFGLGSGTREGN